MRYGSDFSMVEPRKACTHCKVVKPLSDYHKSGNVKDGRASWCKQCTKEIMRPRRKRLYSEENKRKWHLKTRYNLTPQEFDSMVISQGGRCALCPEELKKPCIDHCHNTGKIRGLLCHRCNIRLGGWDDLEWRSRALSYIGVAA